MDAAMKSLSEKLDAKLALDPKAIELQKQIEAIQKQIEDIRKQEAAAKKP